MNWFKYIDNKYSQVDFLPEEFDEPENQYVNYNEMRIEENSVKEIEHVNNDTNKSINKVVNKTESIEDRPDSKIINVNINLKEDLIIESNMNIITNLKLNKKVDIYGCDVLIMKKELKPGVIVGAAVSKVIDGKINLARINTTVGKLLLKKGTMFSTCTVFNDISQVCNIIENETNTQYEPLNVDDVNCENELIKNDLVKPLNKYEKLVLKKENN